MTEDSETSAWEKAVLSIAKGESDVIKVKKLRKQVLLAQQLEDDDKAGKKAFKKAVQSLEKSGDLTIDVDGIITLTDKAKRKAKKDKKEKKKKKKRKLEESNGTAEVADEAPQDADISETRSKACTGNPQGITRMFLGNLPFAVDESCLGEFLDNGITHIKWITDKETGKFYGSAFIEMKDSEAAAAAIAKSGEKLMGRPIKVNFAPARPGDPWPPEKKVVTGGSTTGKQAGGSGVKAMSEKPENCVKVCFMWRVYDLFIICFFVWS